MAMPELCRPVVLFLGLTGCRFSERAALRGDDVAQTPRGLGVRVRWAATQGKRTSGAVFGPTKTHQTRTVPVPAALDGYVRERVAGTAPGGYLSPSPSGGVWTNTNFRARSRWMDATREAGVKGTTIHDLRHTAAPQLARTSCGGRHGRGVDGLARALLAEALTRSGGDRGPETGDLGPMDFKVRRNHEEWDPSARSMSKRASARTAGSACT